jgi:hypothetical protein
MSSTITRGGGPALPPGPSDNVVAQTLGFHRDPAVADRAADGGRR